MINSLKLLNVLNHCFPKQKHPFNMENDGSKTYAQWQFEKGKDTIAFYLDQYTTEEMFKDKTVLDMGCGAAGKSLYYASLGAKHVIGTDIVSSYQKEAEELAKKLELSDRFTFLAGDATRLKLPESSVDTVIMNDFMEHVSHPVAALWEALRLVRAGGRIYINFPPYYHPFGAHLSDVISIPWVHLLFGERTLINAYRALTAGLPDGKERVDFRISKNQKGEDYFSYINQMTVKRFGSILRDLKIHPVYYREVPLRPFLKPLSKLPVTKECFVKMVVCVIEKQAAEIAMKPKTLLRT